jgi:hypothetical protein
MGFTSLAMVDPQLGHPQPRDLLLLPQALIVKIRTRPRNNCVKFNRFILSFYGLYSPLDFSEPLN